MTLEQLIYLTQHALRWRRRDVSLMVSCDPQVGWLTVTLHQGGLNRVVSCRESCSSQQLARRLDEAANELEGLVVETGLDREDQRVLDQWSKR